MEISLELPYPPSVNNYWKIARNRVIISKKGKEYKKKVEMLCRNLIPFHANKRLSVTILCFPPDNRRRDLDNVLKALLDSIEGSAYIDDSQIDSLSIVRAEVVKLGKIQITIQEKREEHAEQSNHTECS